MEISRQASSKAVLCYSNTRLLNALLSKNNKKNTKCRLRDPESQDLSEQGVGVGKAIGLPTSASAVSLLTQQPSIMGLRACATPSPTRRASDDH